MPNRDLALVICNPGEDREKFVAALLTCGLHPVCCCDLKEAQTWLCQEPFRMLLCTENLPDGDFRAVLKAARKANLQSPVIVLSHIAEWDSYLGALGAGAFDCILCPPDPAETKRIIWAALAATAQPDAAIPRLTASSQQSN